LIILFVVTFVLCGILIFDNIVRCSNLSLEVINSLIVLFVVAFVRRITVILFLILFVLASIVPAYGRPPCLLHAEILINTIVQW
jgi:hypothetical protein